MDLTYPMEDTQTLVNSSHLNNSMVILSFLMNKYYYYWVKKCKLENWIYGHMFKDLLHFSLVFFPLNSQYSKENIELQ